ncbi:MAG: nucleotidyltransferase domain-containing protein, partial [Ruminococcus sp.]|nr:nucleotidyltransferase domain-containing protein [Ruminococcus sp.]
MNRTILERLSEIERKEHIRIIHAAESGSYAWGFSSVQSDHDIRFV